MSRHILATYLSTVEKGRSSYDVESSMSKTKSFPLGTDINLMRGYGIELSLNDEFNDWVLWSTDEEDKPVVLKALYLSTKSKEDYTTSFLSSDSRVVDFNSNSTDCDMRHAAMLMSDSDEKRNWVLFSISRNNLSTIV